MTALSLSNLSIPIWTLWKAVPTIDDTIQSDRSELREIVGDLVAAGACDSEYGVQMMMSVFPDQF